MRGQGDDPSQHDVPRGTAPVNIRIDSAGRTGTRSMPVQVRFDGPEEAHASLGGTFAAVHREGAFVYLSVGQLNALNDLFNDLNAIDRVFGTDQTQSPEWRKYFQLQVIQALEALSA